MPVLTRDRLPLGWLDDILAERSCGAVVVFIGRVRGTQEGQRIASIRYEAYESMARSQLDKIAREARERFGARTLIRHRLGSVAAGKAGLVVACAAPHRGEAFAAARFIVERIKKDVPIWKVDFERSSP